MLRRPVGIGHPVHHRARLVLGHVQTPRHRRLLIPAAQAVAAEPGKGHQVDVLHLGPLDQQMLHQRAKGAGLQFGAGGLVKLGHHVPSIHGAVDHTAEMITFERSNAPGSIKTANGCPK